MKRPHRRIAHRLRRHRACPPGNRGGILVRPRPPAHPRLRQVGKTSPRLSKGQGRLRQHWARGFRPFLDVRKMVTSLPNAPSRCPPKETARRSWAVRNLSAFRADDSSKPTITIKADFATHRSPFPADHTINADHSTKSPTSISRRTTSAPNRKSLRSM